MCVCACVHGECAQADDAHARIHHQRRRPTPVVTAGQRVIDLHNVSIIQSRHGDPPRSPSALALADNAAGSVLVRVYSPACVNLVSCDRKTTGSDLEQRGPAAWICCGHNSWSIRHPALLARIRLIKLHSLGVKSHLLVF